MKLNIIHDESDSINNYININILSNNYGLDNIIDNCCEEILIINSMDFINYNKISEFLSKIISKIRLGGRLTIVGIDIRAISKSITNGLLSYDDYNDKIESRKSLSSSTDIRNFFIQHSFEIESETIKGNVYEIIIIR